MKGVLNENEKSVGEFEFSEGKIYVTDRRLIVSTDDEFYDALLWKIPSIQFKEHSSPKYLIAGVICFLIAFLTTTNLLYLPTEIIVILVVLGVSFIILYLRSFETNMKVFVENAEPISITTRSKEPVVEISKLIRHYKSDVRISNSEP